MNQAMTEFNSLSLANHTPIGIYLLPASILTWDGVLFLHRGYYQHAIFRFTISLPTTYPLQPPLITFNLPLFHPLVNPTTGRMNLYPLWRPQQDHTSGVLHKIKAAFKRAALDALTEAQCSNLEAFRMYVPAWKEGETKLIGIKIRYRENHSLFTSLAAQAADISSSNSVLYPTSESVREEKGGIIFKRLSEAELEQTRREVELVGLGKLLKRGS